MQGHSMKSVKQLVVPVCRWLEDLILRETKFAFKDSKGAQQLTNLQSYNDVRRII